jgi:hypothetical protein
MMLFKARLAAQAEVEETCKQHGLTLDEVRDYIARSPRFAHTLHRAPHAERGCTTANLIEQVAPRMKKRWLRAVDRLPLPALV